MSDAKYLGMVVSIDENTKMALTDKGNRAMCLTAGASIEDCLWIKDGVVYIDNNSKLPDGEKRVDRKEVLKECDHYGISYDKSTQTSTLIKLLEKVKSSNYSKSFEKLKEDQDKLASERESFEEEKKVLQSNIDELTKENGDLKTEIDTLKEKIAELEAKLEATQKGGR